MFKKCFTLVVAVVLLPLMLNAQVEKKATLKFDNGNSIESTNSNVTRVNPQTAANYVFVDDMDNTYGPAIGALNVVSYDPWANVIAVVHRGRTTYALGSGELWWNTSTDGGATWVRSTTSVQNGTVLNNARYPSMALYNPNHGTTTADVQALFSWPQLTPSAFGYLGYGISTNLSAADYAAEDQGPPAYSSQVPCWTGDGTPWFFWASDNQTDASIRIFRTSDWSTIEKIDPPQMNDAAFGSNGNVTCGGVSYNGVQYYGVIGSFDATVVPNAWVGAGGWGIGYSKSTDNGATWSDFKTVNWSAIPATARFQRLWDYTKGDGNTISVQGDINVDKNGYVHLVTGLTDTTGANGEYGYNALVEFIETADGWDAKIIVEGDMLLDSTFTQQDGPGLGQMGPSVYLATDKNREVFAVQYVTTQTVGSNYCDIFMQTRTLNGNWSAPMNLTETADKNENGTHLAPYLGGSNGSYTAYSMYFYEQGQTGPIVDPAKPTDIYIAAVPLTITGVENEISGSYNFTLEQNYPNPFNPTTTIKYTVPETGLVTLKVYDVLGSEVATLVNETMTAGQHTVNFNAAGLASGMYIYKMQAGNFQSVKKMMLMK
jgi:hypothetical protein